jgi:hypothetical protein
MRPIGFVLALLLGALWSGGCDCGRITSIDELPSTPRAATANVAGGVKASSPNFRLITTTSPGGGSPESPSFTIRSGVVGATQSATEAQQ